MSDHLEIGTNNISEIIKNIPKNVIIGLITTLVSGSVISYIVSRIFLKSYIATIGFNALTYNILVNNETVNILTLAIFIFFLIIVFTFSFIPIYLRFTYNKDLNLIKSIHTNFLDKIRICITLLLFSTPLLLLLIFHFSKNIYLSFLPLFIAYIITAIFINLYLTRTFITNKNKYKYHWKSLFNLNSVEIFSSIFFFFSFIFTSLFPFYYIILAIANTHNPNFISTIFAIAIWYIYSIVSGMRVVEKEKGHYTIDILIAIFMFIVIITYSIKTIQIPIAEFVGFKDKTTYIYKISSDDFAEIEGDIKAFWDDAYTLKPSPNTQSKNKESYYLAYAINSFNKDVYLYTKVIFRDAENSIICPPIYKIGKNGQNETCFITKSAYLTPTSLTPPTLDKNPKIIDKLWIPIVK